jgi:glucose 1-dehydrogenase
LKLRNKITFITGAGQGIGKAIAFLFAKEGSQVIVTNINLDRAVLVANAINKAGGIAFPLEGDVSNREQVGNMVSHVIEKFGRIDILINNAGLQTSARFLDLSENEWNRVFDVNLKGTFLCSQVISKYMINNGGGKIINISSIHQSIPRYNKAHYDASKAGIAMLTKDMALELAKYKINVNSIAPGAIATEMNKDILESPERLSRLNSIIPWERIGNPEDIALTALFLASKDADYITGATIFVDGGLSLNSFCGENI